MPGWSRNPLLILIALLLALPGCSKKEERAASPGDSKKAENRVIIPEEVQGKWKAVRIAVRDKESGKEDIYTVDLGYEFALPESGITVQTQNFLPAFIMEGKTLTSASNEAQNPAVQIVVRENGKELFKGWLFSLYPGAHTFQHARFSFTLIDFVPATEKS